LPGRGDGRGVRPLASSIIRASSIFWPPGKWSSRVRPTGSSGPNTLSCPPVVALSWSLATIFKVMSGESMVLPSEFAYFNRITSRRLSTRSSLLTSTRVADAFGRLTHTLRSCIAGATVTESGACRVGGRGVAGADGEGWGS
jgi:hypothetical protein